MHKMGLSAAGAMILAGSCAAGNAWGWSLSARQVTEQLYHASQTEPLDLSGADLEGLDLAGLDFKQARLEQANLFGADLSGANLAGTDLHGARLDRVVISGARFDEANLAGASLLRPSTFSTLALTNAEAPSFAGCDMRGARIFGRLSLANFAGTNLEDASLAPFNQTGFIEHLWRTELEAANLLGAKLARADLTYVLFRFANLRGANLSGAILKNADLAHADLTGADLTGADLTNADLDGAILKDVKGLGSVAGLALARNRSKAIE